MTTASQTLHKIAIAVAGISRAWAQEGPPPAGTPPGGTPPGDSTTSLTYYATYKLDGGSATQSNQTYTATATDTSGVWVTNNGSLLLATPTIGTSGGTSSQDNSSFAGLVAAGLYRINVSVPASLAGGTYPVVVTQNGVQSPSKAMLKVVAN